MIFFDRYFNIPHDRTSKQQLGKYLATMNISPVKKAQKGIDKQHYIYQVNADDLLKVFYSNNWLDERVDVINHEIDDDDDNDYENGIDKTDQTVDIKTQYEKQINEHYVLLGKSLNVKQMIFFEP